MGSSCVIETIIAASSKTNERLIWCNQHNQYEESDRLQVLEKSAVCAYNLTQKGIEREDIVALMLPQGTELIQTWLACLILGAIPTILPPPNDRQSPALWQLNLQHIVQYTGAKALICSPDFVVPSADVGREDGSFVSLFISTALYIGPRSLPVYCSSEEQTVLLQHSSGTTGLQKGIALTNDSILTQVDLYGQSIQLNPLADKIISWLPLYHDMGLVACLLMPLITGTELIFMDNFAWALQPTLLFQAISHYRASLCWMPNFAFNFLASRITPEQKSEINLESIRLWINCSETVRHESFVKFADSFYQQSINQATLSSCYAMAENTFAVTQSQPGFYPKTAIFSPEHNRLINPSEKTIYQKNQLLVSSGTPLPHHCLRIVDENGHEIAEGHMGEIIINSPCLMRGYFGRPDLTIRAITEGWYSTGDLGILYQGELYVCGRKKDLIVIAGKNIFPEDVEIVTNEVTGVPAGRSVAFGCFDESEGTEQLIVLAEHLHRKEPDAAERRSIIRKIKKSLSDKMGFTAKEVHLLSPRSLIKSSSGKISRQRCQQLYEEQLNQKA